MTALYSYYLAAGTISKATLIGSSSNNIENFPFQSDQTTPLLGWKEPAREGTERPTLARIAQNADLSRRGDGFYKFKWGFPYWTQGQMAYFLATFFTAANAYPSLSVPATAQTWFESAYVAFTVTLYRPVWGSAFDTEDGGYKNVVIEFDKGTIIT